MYTLKLELMNKLIYIVVLFLFIVVSISAQNKQILFGFEEIPQNLMNNPSATIDQKAHFSVPMLSGIYINAGLTGFNMSNLVINDGLDVNEKLSKLLNNTSRKDYYTVNQQLEVFNIGFRLNNVKKDYLSFGFYEEFDGILYHPKDLVTLAYEGNQDLSKTFNLNDVSFKAELLGVLHVGINRKINKKITLGLRVKMYSSVFNATSRINSGVFSTNLGDNNIYQHRLSNMNMEMKTSGIVNANGELVADEKVYKQFLLSGNMGLGLDFGIDYKVNKKVKIKASLSDLGFIRHVKNTAVYKVKGNYIFDGLNLLFPEGDVVEYWSNLEDDIDEKIKTEVLSSKYTSLRSLKFNSSIGYKFGKSKSNNCLRSEVDNPLSNEVGIQLFSIFRPRQPQFATSLYYYRRFSKHLQAKVTYTVSDFSATNVGAGFSTQMGAFNLYIMADNLIGFTDLSKSNQQSFQLGMNLIL